MFPLHTLMSLDTHQSVYREKLLEHLLIGELLKHSWLFHRATLEVSQPSLDRAGHDVVLEANGVTRHVQLKTSRVGGATASQKVHLGLADKPSGCVIWTQFQESEARDDLLLGPFHFFGEAPGKPLRRLDDLPVARHTKANAEGIKAKRPNIRVLTRSRFKSVSTIAELYLALFGDPRPTMARDPESA